jgi:hypothetical protein
MTERMGLWLEFILGLLRTVVVGFIKGSESLQTRVIGNLFTSGK